MRFDRLVHAVALTVAGLALAAPRAAVAQARGERVGGPITRVELVGEPRRIEVSWNGHVMAQRIHSSMRIVFHQCAECFPNPELSDLKPGMQVHFDYNPDGPPERLHVDSVPPETRRVVPGGRSNAPVANPGRGEERSGSTNGGDSRGGERHDLLVKILDIDERRGEFRADVAGRRQSFVAESPRELRRWQVGDLVVITVEGRGGSEVVTSIRSGATSGRVLEVDRRHGELRLDVDGRTGTYFVDRKELLDDVRVGDRIRFEVTESHGRQLITDIH